MVLSDNFKNVTIKKLKSKSNQSVYNKKWIFLTFLLCAVLCAMRTPNVLFKSYLFAEDGPVFLGRAFEYGFGSIFMPYAGYMSVITQTLTCVSVVISRLFTGGIAIVPQLMQLFQIAIEGFCFAYFVSDRFEFIIKKQEHRSIVCVILSAISGGAGNEIWQTLTYAQWFFGFLVLLICLKMIYEKKITNSKWEIAILVLTGLSSPVNIAVVITAALIMAYLTYKKQVDLNSVITSIVISLPVLVQYTLILSGERQGGNISEAAFATIKCFISCIPAALYPSVFRELCQNYDIVIYFLGILCWALLIVAFIKIKKLPLLLMNIAMILFIIMLSNYSLDKEYYLVGEVMWGSRYYSIPHYLFLLSICIAIYDLHNIYIYIYIHKLQL